jgi:hypothetical protein
MIPQWRANSGSGKSKDLQHTPFEMPFISSVWRYFVYESKAEFVLDYSEVLP